MEGCSVSDDIKKEEDNKTSETNEETEETTTEQKPNDVDDTQTPQNSKEGEENNSRGGADESEETTTPTSTTAAVNTKIKVHFQAVGSAPILRKAKFAIGANEKFAVIPIFLRKHLKLDDHAPLFVYCNSAFCPNLDQRISDLFDVRLCICVVLFPPLSCLSSHNPLLLIYIFICL